MGLQSSIVLCATVMGRGVFQCHRAYRRTIVTMDVMSGTTARGRLVYLPVGPHCHRVYQECTR